MFQSENSEIIANAVKYAKDNAAVNGIDVKTIADNIGFSTNYFNKVFTEHTGFSVMKYVRFERMRMAANMLRSTDKEIFEIALECGYDSHEGFIRSFKSQYGCTPTEYRQQRSGMVKSWGEFIDPTLANRFVFDNPDFRMIDEEDLIDHLLAKNAKRFGYLCTTIKAMGLKAITDFESMDDGFILIGDNRDGSYYLTLVSDDEVTIEKWSDRFDGIEEIQTTADIAIPANAHIRNEYMYFGASYEVDLPNDIDVHKLTADDEAEIKNWTKGRIDGYVSHLRDVKSWVNDDRVLEFGVFKNGIMIGAVGCGIDTVHEFSLNDCINIILDDTNNELYKKIFKYVTNEVIKLDVIPFDNIQYGEYAQTNGGFTSEELGFELVNRVITIR